MSRVAYIVIGWNNKKLLKECFDSIKEQDYTPKKIIYVDNDSKDESVDWLKSHYSDISIIEPGYNTGFARGNNIGIAEALIDPEVTHLVLLNTDARLAPDWTSRLVSFASMKPKGALFQGTTLDYYNHGIIDSTHIYVSHNGQGTQGGWRTRYTNEVGPKKVFGVNAAALMITRSFIEAQPFGKQVFDESMFMYLEDIDLAARATIMGWDNYLVPGARAYHMGSASSGKNPGFSLYMTFRNNSGMIVKNFPVNLIFRMLPLLIRGDIDTVRELRRRGKKSASYKVIKGRMVGILRIPLFLVKRVRVRRASDISSDYLWRMMKKGF